MASRRITYLQCPRCKGQDFYETTRQVGAVGSFGEMEGVNSERLIGGSLPVNKKVKLCRECNEVPIQKSRMSTPAEDAEWEVNAPARAAANKLGLQVGGVFVVIAVLIVLFIKWAVS